MSATRILWGQIVIVLVIVLVAIWPRRKGPPDVGFPPQLGQPWFYIRPGMPVYLPPSFFWWWLVYDAYAPRIFLQGVVVCAGNPICPSLGRSDGGPGRGAQETVGGGLPGRERKSRLSSMPTS